MEYCEKSNQNCAVLINGECKASFCIHSLEYCNFCGGLCESMNNGICRSGRGDVALTYNGTSKGSVPFSGGAKTFQCANKVASGNITIGGATLECANKLMKSNVVVTIS